MYTEMCRWQHSRKLCAGKEVVGLVERSICLIVTVTPYS